MSATVTNIFSELLRKVPNFPNHSLLTWGYPERRIRKWEDSSIILGPPINLYDFQPEKSCSIHVSGIPNWAEMSDVVEIFQKFGKIWQIDLSVSLGNADVNPYSIWSHPVCNGWARVTYCNFDGAQRALFNHLSLFFPGYLAPLSIYKGTVSNVVILKNLPFQNVSKGDILCQINCYPGLLSITFKEKKNAARMVFVDLDSALLFMDIVSGGGLIIEGFTAIVEPEDKDEEEVEVEELATPPK